MGRSPQSVLDEEIHLNDPGILRLVSVDVDRSLGTVTSRLLGLGGRTAVFRQGLGCTLALGITPRDLAARGLPVPGAMPSTVRTAWPVPTDPPAPPPDPAAAAPARDDAFAEPGATPSRRTRAVVVMQNGRIIAERYAQGYGVDSPLPGWSMTKSVINALVGVLVREGRLALDEPLWVPEWATAGDPRGAITLRQALQMSSGLQFSEAYGNPL